jgi:cytoskeletal protein RodZ
MSSIDEPNFDGEAPLPEESNNNRTFMIAVGILGGIILISVACLAAVLLFNRSQTSGTKANANANANSTATAAAFINNALTATSQGLLSLPTTTSTAVPTSVVKAATNTSTADPSVAAAAGTPAAATATVGAALTQAAVAQLTVVVTTTALPKTGIADELGLPGLVVMALAFVIVILLARRLRTAPTLNR